MAGQSRQPVGRRAVIGGIEHRVATGRSHRRRSGLAGVLTRTRP